MLQDRLLIWKFKCGDSKAFCRIYEKYETDLLTLAANLLSDASAAEDVVQDVFISFVRSLENFHLHGSLKSYLATCVANRARDYIRKRRRSPNVGLNETPQATSGTNEPLRLAIQTEELQRLKQAMIRLSYDQREVIILRLHGGLKFKAIAVLQNVSIKTVQSRYRYGLDKLRSILNSESKK